MKNVFSAEDFYKFKDWINFDLNSITWEGKFTLEFDEFWNSFFSDGISLKELLNRFDFSQTAIKTGTLTTWISWINKKFYCYLFVKEGFSILKLSEISHQSVSYIALMLRDFFIEIFPDKIVELNQFFFLSDAINSNVVFTFDDLKKNLDITESDIIKGCTHDDLMTSTEVTLYPEWKNFLLLLKAETETKEINIKKFKKSLSTKNFFNFLKEVILFTSATILIIYGVNLANKYYENYLQEKISIYEPEFLWLDKSLRFKQENLDKEKIELDLKALEEITKATQSVDEDFKPEDRFDTESEVVLTSIENISEEENNLKDESPVIYEDRGDGYRDLGNGNNKVYRLLMKSVNSGELKNKISSLLTEYQVTAVDKVKPGTNIPGGVYYNLHVPKAKLVEFIQKASILSETSVFESKTRTSNPAGKVKVFLWIKEI